MNENTASPYIVGIGASAGGLDAIKQLLSHLPADAPLCIVLIQHLDRVFPSALAELLAPMCKLTVAWISDNTRMVPGHVYVLPPDRQVLVRDGVLHLEKRKAATVTATIDDFLRSLGEDCKERSVAVILSGAGSDGTAGIRSIKGNGGLVFVQKETTAAFPAMARAAIEAGDVDSILPPAEIAQELANLATQGTRVWMELTSSDNETTRSDPDTWAAIFRLLSARKGVDFSDYKQSTITRRLVRRMILVKTDRLGDYFKLLQTNRAEVDRLYDSLLINVTSFFRDREYFEYIEEEVLPKIVAHHADGSPIRLWVAGCSTGEEAYSLGMLVSEALEKVAHRPVVQIFATDVSEDMIAFARAGTYPAGALNEVLPERLRRFFTDTPRGFVVNKSLRDMCIFARQDLTKDSPFSRLDLISCRNVLIYLGPPLQQKLMSIFHYALKPTGYLVLGNSESVASHADLFRLIDRRFRIYSRKSTSRRMNFEFVQLPSAAPELTTASRPKNKMPDDSSESFDVLREADRLVLGRHSPSGVLVNEELEILQFRGNVSRYLAPTSGRASLNVVKMAVEGLAAEIESAVQEAGKKNSHIVRKGVRVLRGDRPGRIDIDVTPIDIVQTKERFFLILFIEMAEAAVPEQPTSETPGAKSEKKSAQLEAQIEQLKQDLDASRNYVQTTIEKYEAANQELRAANEEIQSSNEELQSTNEELETAKEELQSTNEELTTVNEELHSRQTEMIQLNNDLTNLINSVHLPIVILGHDMRIRRFTPLAERVLNVIPTDIGRPISDLNINLNVTGLARTIGEVMDSLTFREIEVQNDQGRWYSLRLRPYKTSDNKIDGVVMTLIDVDETRQNSIELERSRAFASTVADSVSDPLVAIASAGKVYKANEAFYQLLGAPADRGIDQRLDDLFPSLRDVPGLADELESMASPGTEPLERWIEVVLPRGGSRKFQISARRVGGSTPESMLIVIRFQG